MVQVSVRKAALGVCSGLLRALPHEASLAALWVAAALPLVRDVEASLQEQLLDSFHDFVIVPAGARSTFRTTLCRKKFHTVQDLCHQPYNLQKEEQAQK